MLNITSFIFASNVLYALCLNEYTIGILTTILYGTSILVHSQTDNTNQLILMIDRLCAKLIWCVIVYKNFHLSNMIVWLISLYVPLVYYSKIYNKPYNQKNIWHASIHITSSIGINTYIYHFNNLTNHGISLR